MAHRVLELKIISASKLKDVNLFSRMEVYAVASVDGDRRKNQRTEEDPEGMTNPKWDQDRTLRFMVPPTAAAAFESDLCLRVLLRTKRLFSFSHGDVGEVVIPLAELLADACDYGGATAWRRESFQVRKVQGRERRGTLNLSYRFGPVPFVQGNACQLPPRQYYAPHPYAPMQPPPYPRMLPGGFGGMWLGDMPSYDAAGHGTAAVDAGAVAV